MLGLWDPPPYILPCILPDVASLTSTVQTKPFAALFAKSTHRAVTQQRRHASLECHPFQPSEAFRPTGRSVSSTSPTVPSRAPLPRKMDPVVPVFWGFGGTRVDDSRGGVTFPLLRRPHFLWVRVRSFNEFFSRTDGGPFRTQRGPSLHHRLLGPL